MTRFVEVDAAGQKTTLEMQGIIKNFNQELLGNDTDLATALKQYQPEALVLLSGRLRFIANCAQENISGIQITQDGKTFELV